MIFRFSLFVVLFTFIGAQASDISSMVSAGSGSGPDDMSISSAGSYSVSAPSAIDDSRPYWMDEHSDQVVELIKNIFLYDYATARAVADRLGSEILSSFDSVFRSADIYDMYKRMEMDIINKRDLSALPILHENLAMIGNSIDSDLFTKKDYNDRLEMVYYSRSGMRRLLPAEFQETFDRLFKSDSGYNKFMSFYNSKDKDEFVRAALTKVKHLGSTAEYELEVARARDVFSPEELEYIELQLQAL